MIARLQDGPRAFAVSVRLNDRVTASLMLDTGASGLTISRKLAEKAGARKLSEHSLEGVGSAGALAGYVGWLDKVTVGDFEFHDCNIHVSPNMNADYDGLIGTDVFEKYLVTIDFPAHELHLVQEGLEPDDWKAIVGVGSGVYELRIRTAVEHRVFYVAKFAEVSTFCMPFRRRRDRLRNETLSLPRSDIGRF